MIPPLYDTPIKIKSFWVPFQLSTSSRLTGQLASQSIRQNWLTLFVRSRYRISVIEWQGDRVNSAWPDFLRSDWFRTCIRVIVRDTYVDYGDANSGRSQGLDLRLRARNIACGRMARITGILQVCKPGAGFRTMGVRRKRRFQLLACTPCPYRHRRELR